MKNQGQQRLNSVSFDSNLSYLVDGFLGQIICSLTGVTEVYRQVGKQDELVYMGCDDVQEMQVQMMADHHLQQLESRMRETLLKYIIENKLYTGDMNKIKLLKEGELKHLID